jgi:hypothetical protein
MKTATLIEEALDWAVAKALGFFPAKREKRPWGVAIVPAPEKKYSKIMINAEGQTLNLGTFHPSSDDEQGGRIIDMKLVGTTPCFKAAGYENPTGEWYWQASMPSEDGSIEESCYGKTRLVAAMRKVVTSELGEDVSIPTELYQ